MQSGRGHHRGRPSPPSIGNHPLQRGGLDKAYETLTRVQEVLARGDTEPYLQARAWKE